jgi:signal transduction histidine kinase
MDIIQDSKILIIDDTPLNIDYLIRYLDRAGFRVLVAKDGEMGIYQAKYNKPDIILLDVLMPHMNGFETCRRLKSHDSVKDIPVIFMTALSSVTDKMEGFRVGAVDYVTKPIDQQEVMARVTTHLTIRNLQKELQDEVAERKKNEVMLRQYAATLQAQNEELDAYAHTVAHNLKNPLSLIASLAEFLLADHALMNPKELSQCLTLMMQDGLKAVNIVDELLLLASVRTEDVEPAPLDMPRIITETHARLADMISESRTKIIFPTEWPKAIGYAPWVEEVWVNYLSNAIKYGGTPPCVKLGATRQPNKMIQFWVQDNGPGISPAVQSQLFTPFRRLNPTKIEGHGLGLSIVRRIVEKLGGEVGLESQGIPGQGAIFNFTLPAVI